MKTKQELYRELELIPYWVPDPSSTSRRSQTLWLRQVWTQVCPTITPAQLWNLLRRHLLGSADPTISVVRDRQGNLFWKVYDPVTRQSMRFESENAIRIWLDQRYSH